MKIRNRIVLLALAPVPALIILGYATWSQNRVELDRARSGVAAEAVVGAADALAGSLLDERRIAAEALASSEISLDTLLVAQESVADVLSGSDPEKAKLAAQARALSAERLAAFMALARPLNLAGTRPEFQRVLDSLLAALPGLEAGRVSMREARTLNELLRPFEDVVSRVVDLHAALATSRSDPVSARLAATGAALARMRVLVETESLSVYFALVSRQLTPQQARDVFALEGRLESTRRELANVFAMPDQAAALDAAWERAQREGRAAAMDTIFAHAQRLRDLADLQGELGVSGAILHYTTFALRGDPEELDRFRRSRAGAAEVLERMRTQSALGGRERQDVEILQAALDDFAHDADPGGRTAHPGSANARPRLRLGERENEVNEALRRLRTFDPPVSTGQWRDQWGRLGAALADLDRDLAGALRARGVELVAVAQRNRTAGSALLFLTIAGTLGLAFLITLRLSRGFSTMSAEFRRIATTGDVGSELPVSGTDELAGLHRSVLAINARIADIARVGSRMAVGDYRTLPQPLGPRDALALAVQDMGTAARSVIEQAGKIARGDYQVLVTPRSEADDLGRALADMTRALRRFALDIERRRWIDESRLALFDSLRGQRDVDVMADRMLEFLAERVGAFIGLLYLHGDGALDLCARYAVPDSDDLPARIAIGDGQVGQAFRSKELKVVEPVPADYLRIRSATGSAPLAQLVLIPLRAVDEAVGVLELGFATAPSERALELLRFTAESIAVALAAAVDRARTESLLQETQLQAEKLQSQQEELQATNEELQEQAVMLRQSEEALRAQREVLQTTNEELAEKGGILERQKAQLQRTANELEQATRYKSEFLANMSHELRTPLNSLLILSKQLAANEEGNLSDEQVEAAAVIHEGGRDLLTLINDILDMSKVEAGRLTIHPASFDLRSLVDDLRQQFEPIARQRQLEFVVNLDDDVPSHMTSDRQRVVQVLRNLLSNAFKFTERGRVMLSVGRPGGGLQRRRRDLKREAAIALSVSDTGCGIPPDKLEMIFEAFQQADGSTGRRYGGTGLGLTISRQMAGLLGGEIHVRSVESQGSVFTLIVPEVLSLGARAEEGAPPRPPATVSPPSRAEILPIVRPDQDPDDEIPEPAVIEDDRDLIKTGGRSLLIIEDDLKFAAVLRDLARRRGFRCLVADHAATGLHLAFRYRPSGIVLDLKLPDADGLRVLEALKQSPRTRHIPVHVVSALDANIDALACGAIGYLAKPAERAELLRVLELVEGRSARSRRSVLVIENDRRHQVALRQLLENEWTRVIPAAHAARAMEILASEKVDCVVLDLSVPDTDALEFLRKLRADPGEPHPPVVVHTGRDLSAQEQRELSELAHNIVVKGVDSPERLLDEVQLFLHALDSELTEPQRQVLARLPPRTESFRGRKLLLVDDDMRNTFALSGALRRFGFEVLIADNGQLALERLDQHPDTSIVILDVMMPVMDGYEALRRIRLQERFRNLPVIALTAKVMAEDRRQCMEMGATDFLTKPVDVEQLLAAVRLWLGQVA